MFRLNLVAIHFFAGKLAVERVQIQAMFAGNQRIRFFQIGAQFFRRARLPGIISRAGRWGFFRGAGALCRRSPQVRRSGHRPGDKRLQCFFGGPYFVNGLNADSCHKADQSWHRHESPPLPNRPCQTPSTRRAGKLSPRPRCACTPGCGASPPT